MFESNSDERLWKILVFLSTNLDVAHSFVGEEVISNEVVYRHFGQSVLIIEILDLVKFHPDAIMVFCPRHFLVNQRNYFLVSSVIIFSGLTDLLEFEA